MSALEILFVIAVIAAIVATFLLAKRNINKQDEKEVVIPSHDISNDWKLVVLPSGVKADINGKLVEFNTIILTTDIAPTKKRYSYEVDFTMGHVNGTSDVFSKGELKGSDTVSVNDKKYYGKTIAQAPKATIEQIRTFKVS